MDQLSKDSVAAQQAGMSYGKYMAVKEQLTQRTMRVNPVPAGTEKWLTCPRCGKVFKRRARSAQKYCELYCQQEAHKERQKKRLQQKKAGLFI